MTLGLPLFTAIFRSLSLSQSSSAHLVTHKAELTQDATEEKMRELPFKKRIGEFHSMKTRVSTFAMSNSSEVKSILSDQSGIVEGIIQVRVPPSLLQKQISATTLTEKHAKGGPEYTHSSKQNGSVLLDENKGIYIHDIKSGEVKSVLGAQSQFQREIVGQGIYPS
jgi:Major Vault Protein repeat domain